MQRKLRDKDVIEIKTYLKEGKVSTKWLKKEYNITSIDISNIKNNGYYKDLDQFVK